MADAPVATMTASARCSTPPAQSRKGRSAEVDALDVLVHEAGPEAGRLLAEEVHQLGALDAVRKARVVLDVAGQHQLATRHGAGDDERLEVGPRGVDRGGQAGRDPSRR